MTENDDYIEDEDMIKFDDDEEIKFVEPNRQVTLSILELKQALSSLSKIVEKLVSSSVTEGKVMDLVTAALSTRKYADRVKEEQLPQFYVYYGPNGQMPTRSKDHDAGWDLYAAQNIVVSPARPVLVSTDVYLEVPPGWEAQIRPRSGLAIKQGVSVANTPGTVDATYLNEVRVGLVNHTEDAYQVKKGDRIAQIVFYKLDKMNLIDTTEKDPKTNESIFDSVEEFQAHFNEKYGETGRGQNGFGSSGK